MQDIMGSRLRRSAGFLFIFFAAFFSPSNLSAQTTQVTGTVTDVNGIPYAGAQMKAQLVFAGTPVSNPTVTISVLAQCRANGFGSAPCQVPFAPTNGPFNLDGGGNIPGGGITLQDNTQVTPSGTQWAFSVNTAGNPPPLGTGPQTCSATLTISGGSQIISSSFAACPKLSNSGSGGASSGPNIKRVQDNGQFVAFASSSNPTAAFSKANTAGNTLVLLLGLAVASSGNTCTPSSTDGDVWSQAGPADLGQSTIFIAIAKGGAVNTVTCAMSGSSTGAMSVAEYSGVLNAHVIASQSTPSGNPAFIQAVIFNPVAGSLLIAMDSHNGNSASYGSPSGCTWRVPVISVTNAWCDNTNAPFGLNRITWPQTGITGGTDFIAKLLVLLPATAATVSQPTPTRLSQKFYQASSSTSPMTDVFNGGNTTGNCILVLTKQAQTADDITTVTDSAGNTYTRLSGAGARADSGGFAFYADYVAPVTASSNSDNTISVAFSAGTLQFAAMEIAGSACANDGSALGTNSYSVTTSGAMDLLVTIQGFGGGGVVWTGLSGFDASDGTFGSSNGEINYFLSCSSANQITSFLSQAGNTSGGLTEAILPAGGTTSTCPQNSGSQANSPPNSTTTYVGVAKGTSTASSTLGFYGFGQNTTPNFTSTIVNLGVNIVQATEVKGFYLGCGTGGVNSSSGAATLLKNGSPFTTSITATIGTGTAIADFSHPQTVAVNDVLSAQITTQAADTLANCTIYVVTSP